MFMNSQNGMKTEEEETGKQGNRGSIVDDLSLPVSAHSRKSTSVQQSLKNPF